MLGVSLSVDLRNRTLYWSDPATWAGGGGQTPHGFCTYIQCIWLCSLRYWLQKLAGLLCTAAGATHSICICCVGYCGVAAASGVKPATGEDVNIPNGWDLVVDER
jgi:hypothetical protein